MDISHIYWKKIILIQGWTMIFWSMRKIGCNEFIEDTIHKSLLFIVVQSIKSLHHHHSSQVCQTISSKNQSKLLCFSPTSSLSTHNNTMMWVLHINFIHTTKQVVIYKKVVKNKSSKLSNYILCTYCHLVGQSQSRSNYHPSLIYWKNNSNNSIL